MLKLLDAPTAVGQVFNIGGPEEVPNRAALPGLSKSGSTAVRRISYIPYDQAYEEGFEDMSRRVPSTAKIEHLTGWRATTSLDKTIDLIACHFRQKQIPLASRTYPEVQPVPASPLGSRQLRSELRLTAGIPLVSSPHVRMRLWPCLPRTIPNETENHSHGPNTYCAPQHLSKRRYPYISKSL